MFAFCHLAAFMVAFLGSSCDPVEEPCVFNNPIDAILGLFSMSVGDFEDIIQTFPRSRYSTLVYVSHTFFAYFWFQLSFYFFLNTGL